MVDINKTNMALFFKFLSMRFRAGLDVEAPIDTSLFCEDLPVSTDETDFSWLGEADDLREWKDGRELTELAAYKYAITNREWERTIRARLRDIENDRTGLYALRAEKLGRAARRWKMLRVLEALKSGTTTPCHDGQNFFDTDHPCGVEGTTTGAQTTFSNLDSGVNASPFYLFDTSHVIMPLIFQAEAPVFEQLSDPNTSDHVFMHREALYGVRAYGGAGYSFPQYALCSQNTFSKSLYQQLRQRMAGFTNLKGQLVGANPTLLVYGRGQRDTIEDILFASNVAVTGNDVSGAGGVGLRKPTVFSGLSTLYVKFLP